MGAVRQSKVVMIHRLNTGERPPSTALPTDIVAFRGDKIPQFVNSNGRLEVHPPHVTRTHPTVLNVSREQGDEILWRSNQPFSIAKITDHDTGVEARPFGWGSQRAAAVNEMHVVASGLPEADAHGGNPDGRLYKAWIKFDDETELLDPDFNCSV